MGYLIINSQQDYQDYPPSLTCKGCSFEPLEPHLLRAWLQIGQSISKQAKPLSELMLDYKDDFL